MRRYTLLLLCIIAVTSLGTGMETHDIQVYSGETFELDPYVFEYGQHSHGEQEQYFKIGEEDDDTVWVLEQYTGDALYDRVGDTIDVGQDIRVTIEELDRDDDGLFVDLNVSGPASVFSSAAMEGDSPDRVIASQGSTVDVPLTIENTGLTNQTFQLSANTSLDVTFGHQGFNISEIFVRPGEMVDIDTTVSIPENAETGDHEVVMEALNTSELSYSFITEVRGQVAEPEMRFDVSQQYAGMTPGDETRISVSARNMGEPTLQDIEFDVTVPDGWEYTLRPEGHPTLERYDRARSTLVIEAPATVQPGDHFVEVSASSERTSAEAQRIRINVSEPSEMGHIGLALMGASFLLLVIVFLAFRRR